MSGSSWLRKTGGLTRDSVSRCGRRAARPRLAAGGQGRAKGEFQPWRHGASSPQDTPAKWIRGWSDNLSRRRGGRRAVPGRWPCGLHRVRSALVPCHRGCRTRAITSVVDRKYGPDPEEDDPGFGSSVPAPSAIDGKGDRDRLVAGCPQSRPGSGGIAGDPFALPSSELKPLLGRRCEIRRPGSDSGLTYLSAYALSHGGCRVHALIAGRMLAL